jgi:epoxyqueuosine reductase
MHLTKDQFEERFRQSPVRRAKYAGFLRNVAVALGNSRDERAVPILAQALEHVEPLVRSHAVWALGQIGGEESYRALEEALKRETDPDVLEEIRTASKICETFEASPA